MRWILGLILVLMLAGCVGSNPRAFQGEDHGQWSGRIVVVDKKKDEQNNLDFDTIADRERGVRVEVSALMGTSVGSLLLTPEELRLRLHRQRKFYRGAPRAKVMKRIVGFAFDPTILPSVFFETSPESELWRCESDDENRVKSCVSVDKRVRANWTYGEGAEKTIKITSKTFEIRFHVESFNPDFKLKTSHFRLTPSKGYRVYRVK